jgi:hypothetical protein
MASLVHEIWFTEDLPECALAGPMGDGQRALMALSLGWCDGSSLGHIFEAMTIYNQLLRRGPYSTDFPEWDKAPYPEDWGQVQEAAGIYPDEVARMLGDEGEAQTL